MDDPQDQDEKPSGGGFTRRAFLTQITVVGAGLSFAPLIAKSVTPASELSLIELVKVN